MDYIALVGLALGLLAIIVGQWLEGGSLIALVNGVALIIVIGGTFGATALQSRLSTFVGAMRSLPSVFSAEDNNETEILRKVVRWAHIVRKEGFLGLERSMNLEKDPFFRKALTYLVDGVETQSLRDALQMEIALRQESEIESAKVFLAMGGYSPTIGIIGAVLGLIHVMHNLSDPTMLGTGIATAFAVTVYGVGLANLVFLPVYNKLRNLTAMRARSREMLMEGIVAISRGENPRFIELEVTKFPNLEPVMSRFYRHRQMEQDPDNHDRWMVSYADFITLLFAFFVVMYALSMSHEGSFRVLSESLEEAFNPEQQQSVEVAQGELPGSDSLIDLGGDEGVLDGGSGVVEAVPELSDSMEKLQELAGQQLMAPIAEEVKETFSALIESGGVNVTSDDLWMQIDIESGVLFESGRARLQPSAISTMQSLAATLKKFPHDIQVEGYTDNVPIQNDIYPSNWELSAARAASVVHLFTQNGVNPQRMSAVGFGEFRPVADNTTVDGRAKNRRVAIVVLADKQAGRLIDLQQQLKRDSSTEELQAR